MRRYAVVGSRIRTPEGVPIKLALMYVVLRARVKGEVEHFISELPPDAVVVSGGAPDVDTWAYEAAAKRGLATIVHRAEWGKLGKRAGIARNPKIVEDCDEVHAWWDRESRGTKDTIDLAREAGKPLTVYAFDRPSLQATLL